MAKVAFNERKTLFTSKLDLELSQKLVKCYIWSIALYGAETWALRTLDQKYKYYVLGHYPSSRLLSKMSSCLYFKIQHFRDWILSQSSGKTYSVGSNRQS
jgi:hypothetical protein